MTTIIQNKSMHRKFTLCSACTLPVTTEDTQKGINWSVHTSQLHHLKEQKGFGKQGQFTHCKCLQSHMGNFMIYSLHDGFKAILCSKKGTKKVLAIDATDLICRMNETRYWNLLSKQNRLYFKKCKCNLT